MERQELISVIIPVYKTERYLEKCVQSVLGQTYGELEVILVDDGSPDGCPALCDALARRDGRVRVIHQANGGLSAARNAGIGAAAGAYIGFVDSDDYILPEMYEKLAAALTETGADMSLCDYRCVDETGAPARSWPPLETGVIGREEAFRRLTDFAGGWRYVTAVNRLYRRALFDGLRFREGRLYEDEFLAHQVFGRCGSVAVIPDRLYCYLQRAESITGTPVSIRRLDAAQALIERYDYFRRLGLRDLAAVVAGAVYWCVEELVDQVDVWRYRDQVGPYVRRASAIMVRHLDHRCLSLPVAYRRRLRACRAEDERHER